MNILWIRGVFTGMPKIAVQIVIKQKMRFNYIKNNKRRKKRSFIKGNSLVRKVFVKRSKMFIAC